MRKFLPFIIVVVVCSLMVAGILTITSSLRSSDGGTKTQVKVNLDGIVIDLRQQLQKELRDKESLLQEIARLTADRTQLQGKLADAETGFNNLYETYRVSQEKLADAECDVNNLSYMYDELQDNFTEACETIEYLRQAFRGDFVPPSPSR